MSKHLSAMAGRSYQAHYYPEFDSGYMQRQDWEFWGELDGPIIICLYKNKKAPIEMRVSLFANGGAPVKHYGSFVMRAKPFEIMYLDEPPRTVYYQMARDKMADLLIIIGIKYCDFEHTFECVVNLLSEEIIPTPSIKEFNERFVWASGYRFSQVGNRSTPETRTALLNHLNKDSH